MNKNFKLIILGTPQVEIPQKIIHKQINQQFKSFINKMPKQVNIVLKLDLTNQAAIRGQLEYEAMYEDFQSSYTADNIEEVSRQLIVDLESKLNSWKKFAA